MQAHTVSAEKKHRVKPIDDLLPHTLSIVCSIQNSIRTKHSLLCRASSLHRILTDFVSTKHWSYHRTSHIQWIASSRFIQREKHRILVVRQLFPSKSFFLCMYLNAAKTEFSDLDFCHEFPLRRNRSCYGGGLSSSGFGCLFLHYVRTTFMYLIGLFPWAQCVADRRGKQQRLLCQKEFVRSGKRLRLVRPWGNPGILGVLFLCIDP